MEFLNRIELRGIVGFSQTIKCVDACVTKFSVCTEHNYQTKDGESICEATWFQVTMMGDKPPIKKGDAVSVVGRLRAFHYVDHNGNDVTSYEVLANNVKVIEK